MKPEKLYGNVILHEGDCRDVLKSLKSNSVDSVVTDPPYHLVSIAKRFTKTNEDDDNKTGRAAKERSNEFARLSRGFMNQTWDGGDIAYQVDLWKEVLRILKPGGHLLSFGGTRTYHRMACAIEDAGFEIRDQIQWIYGSGFPKSQNVARMIDKELGVKGKFGEFKSGDHEGISKRCKMRGNQGQEGWQRPWMNDPEALENYSRKYIPASKEGQEFDGFGTGLKPACEPIVLARKPLSERTVAANVLKWGTGALNVDGCRVKTDENLNGGAYANKGGRSKLTGDERDGASAGMFQSGKTTGNDFTQPIGRWPANLCHDGSDEVVGMFPETISGSGNKANRRPLARQVMETLDTGQIWEQDSGSAARFFFSVNESNKQWLARNLPIDHVNYAAKSSVLPSEVAVSVLKNVVEKSMPQLELTYGACQELSMNVTVTELKKICEFVIETIQSLGERYLQELLPLKHSQSNSLVKIVAIQKQIDIIMITASLSKLSGYVDPVILKCMLPNSEVGGKDSKNGRVFYSAKADKDNRFGSKHPTVKPVDLIRYLIRLVTPKNGLVLDPFAGSGTTGESAFLEDMQAVLIERESEYCEDIRRRMKWVKAHPDDRAYEIAKASGEAERQRRAFDDVWDAKK